MLLLFSSSQTEFSFIAISRSIAVSKNTVDWISDWLKPFRLGRCCRCEEQVYRTWRLFDTCSVSNNPVDWIIDPVEAISTVPLQRTGVSNLAHIIST